MRAAQGNRGEAAIVEAVVILPTVFIVLSALFMGALWFADRALISEKCETFASLSVAEYLNPGSYSVLTDTGTCGGLSDLAVAFLEHERGETPDEDSPVWAELCAELERAIEESSLFGSASAECKVELESGLFGDRINVSATVNYGDAYLLPGTMLVNTVETEKRINDFDASVTNGELITDLVNAIISRSGEIGSLAETWYGKIFAKK